MTIKITLLSTLLLFSAAAHCVTWTITSSGLTFSPDSITIDAGDSVLFQIAVVHNAVEVSQATWNANGNTPLPGFQLPQGGGLVLPAQLGIGVHYYVCQPHASSGMKGRIFVVSPSAVTNASFPADRIKIYPNPAKDKLSVIGYQSSEKSNIGIYDILGQKVYSENLTINNYQLTIDVAELRSGIYFVILHGEKNSIATKFIKQ